MVNDYINSIQSTRPLGYQYFDQLKEHIGDLSKIFNGELEYPRQIEVHLPADHVKRCNFNCYWCQGRLLDNSMGNCEFELFKLLGQLKKGDIHYIVQGGNYTEPLLNPFVLQLAYVAKVDLGASHGIHTNGSLMLKLEKRIGFLRQLCELSNSKEDYVSISLDAGSAKSHMLGHGLKENWFDTILEGIGALSQIRGNQKYPAIRICYLLNECNSSEKELNNIVQFAYDNNVDSIKFSIPYDLYGKDFNKVRIYKKEIEIIKDREYRSRLQPLITTNGQTPHVFYLSPYTQDVDRLDFKQCIYGYFQISAGADGYWYKCSAMATPSFPHLRLGKITSNLDEWHKMIIRNQSPVFNPQKCFTVGGRCNRMAIECNKEWEALNV